MSPASITIFFDQECALCRTLASFGKSLTIDDPRYDWVPNSFQGLTSQDDDAVKLNVLRVEIIDSEGLKTSLKEADAWTWLLAHLPAFNRFHWMAAKLGLTDSALGQKALNLSYSVLKMIRKSCIHC